MASIANGLCCFSEYLPKLKQLIIFIWPAENTQPLQGVNIGELALVLDASKTTLLLVDRSTITSEQLLASLPTHPLESIRFVHKLPPGSRLQSVDAEKPFITIKFMLDLNPLANSHDFSIIPWSSREIPTLEYLQCAACNCRITKSAHYKVQDLPSEYWQELVDCWSCHRQEFASASKMTSAITPKVDIIYSGLEYFLLNKQNIDDGLIAKGREFSCYCGEYLGDLSPESVKVFKYQVTVGAPGDAFANLNLKKIVMHELYQLMQAHACYRFLVSCDGRPSVMIWLMSWESVIRISGEDKYKLAFKVGFLSNDELTSDDQSVEVLQYPPPKMNALLSMLESGSGFLPNEFPFISNYRVSYLVFE